MFKWQAHQKHIEDQRKLLKDLGFTDSQGSVRRFNGKQFWPRFEALGHTSFAFENCECRSKITQS